MSLQTDKQSIWGQSLGHPSHLLRLVIFQFFSARSRADIGQMIVT